MKDIILAPIVTEKTAGIQADGKKVAFKVLKNANTSEWKANEKRSMAILSRR